MIAKVWTLFLIVGGLIVASILSYYLNVRFDGKTVIAFLKQKFRNLFSMNSISQSSLNTNRVVPTTRFFIKF
jgi:hypothetical protein